ncbi:L-carnitine CoA-transferase [Desulfitobacterium sp. LBE]|uniref:L-carnitine dehydratase/bile acid-inducible protein F n=2 Tax=root TaxID=1 RepID=B8G0V5_DESHD|nr:MULTISPECIES: CoA transferase [Desulfitobacterium]ACL18374.1 L-carnitine dehydratase/bile acid-inducible protein F [Desulfitobacterium hafniense DCB-2]MEA5023662.1 CoA transferase [Desulfitobacterium hafniense]TWH58698.1 L-carnitine CoA-transferase [Desulfitobacterium sp. LBE]
MKSSEIPKFGPLSGVKVISCGLSVAGPFAAAMMADFGADVIFVESPIVKDQFRTTDSLSYLNKDRRNHRAIVLDVVKPEGKEIFLSLLKDADIFIENSKAGTWDKRGLGDEELWKVNPKLVITHISGYGQTGEPEYLSRGSYDSIGQAFSGFMNMNGEPDGLPAPAPAYMGDYVAGLTGSWATLAAYINAQKTGVGESIDCAQFEALLMIQAGFPSDWINYKIERKRSGASSPTFAGCQPYKCQDGYVYTFFLSTLTLQKGLPLLGLEFGSPDFPSDKYAVFKGTPGAELLHQRLEEFCAVRTVMEAEKELNAHGIVSSAIITYQTMYDHPHYKARGVFQEYDAFEGGKFIAPAIAPRLKNNPGKVWRAAPSYGKDNEDVLEELGYSSEQIKDFYAKNILKQDPTC